MSYRGFITTPLKQNDSRLAGEASIKPYGCLVTTIREIVESHHGEFMDEETYLEAYRWLVKKGHILDEPGKQAWVIDHGRVGQAFQWYLDKDQTFEYVYREDLGSDNSKSFGSRERATYFAVYARIEGYSIGHFFEAFRDGSRRWDPYWPASPVKEILSLRGYRM